MAQRIRAIGDAQVCASIIVAAELRYGATNMGSARLTAELGAVLDALDVLPFEGPADIASGRLRVSLDRRGMRSRDTCTDRQLR